ncbi:glutamate racemase [Candidatus Berkelbacteria bacterium RIFCSPHIGHO2_12_FULL_36_9]|uniref:Glutamate racemase n=1 Tax=Candidatus Berkelbacteria bacterium RIFCSPHIGHO2_12_FULL_36_9 TaxID=1797469 RepID=A0A1F5EEL0_9BACT|nr:MAG: glutamate racemase [Candidatus Berkelbacteria bacterium RIFCSPHIGHO2_12_FULL_36_9]
MKDCIGIFDSGVGGLGIFQEIKKLLPKENIIYLADSKNCPYGRKSIQQIKKICWDNTQFLINKGAKIVIIACNTGSTIALEHVRHRLLHTPRRCMQVPVVGVVPVVKTAAEVTKNKRIGILATKATIESKYLRDLVEEFCPKKDGFEVFYQAANELVNIVENFSLSHPESFDCHSERSEESRDKLSEESNNGMRFFTNAQNDIKKTLELFIKNGVDVIALGCTHFPFLRQQIEQIMGSKVIILDSNGAVARQVAKIADSLSLTAYCKAEDDKPYAISHIPIHQFYTSGDQIKLKRQIFHLIGLKTNVESEICNFY